MKITDVRTAVVEANYDWTFTRIYTDDEGLTGIGESFLAPGLTQIIRDLKPLLVGEDPRNVDKLWSKMRWAADPPAASNSLASSIRLLAASDLRPKARTATHHP